MTLSDATKTIPDYVYASVISFLRAAIRGLGLPTTSAPDAAVLTAYDYGKRRHAGNAAPQASETHTPMFTGFFTATIPCPTFSAAPPAYDYDAYSDLPAGGTTSVSSVSPAYDYDPLPKPILGTGDSTAAAFTDYAFRPRGRHTSAHATRETIGEQTFTAAPHPETHLYYYGHRYYSPNLGRWPSRDPIGEMGGLNVYGFVRNNPVGLLDILGMRWNNPNRDPSRSRAHVSRHYTRPYASIQTLANMLKLDPSEAFGPSGWLRRLNGEEVADEFSMGSICWFSVPNEVHFTVGDLSPSRGRFDVDEALRVRKARMKQHFEDKEYKVIDHDQGRRRIGQTRQAAITSLRNAKSIYVWAHYGHGRSGSLSFRTTDDIEPLQPNNMGGVLDYKLSQVILYSCEAGNKRNEWTNLVATTTGGKLWATINEIHVRSPWTGRIIDPANPHWPLD